MKNKDAGYDFNQENYRAEMMPMDDQNINFTMPNCHNMDLSDVVTSAITILFTLLVEMGVIKILLDKMKIGGELIIICKVG